MNEEKQVQLHTCKLCGKTGMEKMGYHVRKKHKMSMEEYAKATEGVSSKKSVLKSAFNFLKSRIRKDGTSEAKV